MNRDIELSIYRENRDLKALVNDYRDLVDQILRQNDIAPVIKNMIQKQQSTIEARTKKKI